MMYTEEDITITDEWIIIKGIGRIGIWWKYYDKKVTLSYETGIDNNFIAESESKLKKKILEILNKKQMTFTHFYLSIKKPYKAFNETKNGFFETIDKTLSVPKSLLENNPNFKNLKLEGFTIKHLTVSE